MWSAKLVLQFPVIPSLRLRTGLSEAKNLCFPDSSQSLRMTTLILKLA